MRVVVQVYSAKPERFAMRDARTQRVADDVQLVLETLTEVIHAVKRLDPRGLEEINAGQPLDLVYTFSRIICLTSGQKLVSNQL